MTDVSIITEAFNLDEGKGGEALARTLRYLLAVAPSGTSEILLALTNPDHPELGPIRREFPCVRLIDCRGMGYDAAKMEAARAARGEFLAFLDGDCVPTRRDWLSVLLEPVRRGEMPYAGGVTIYRGGYFAQICSILDFGYLYGIEAGGIAGCYASNNWATRRDRLIGEPILESSLRCNCFAHAQWLIEKGTPFRMVPAAQVAHELPPFFGTRWNRGRGFVEDPLANAKLPPAWSSRSILKSAWRIYVQNLERDRQRLPAAARMFGFSPLKTRMAELAFPIFRTIDFVAIVSALRDHPRSRDALASAAGSRP